jgi:hypothetical protein
MMKGDVKTAAQGIRDATPGCACVQALLSLPDYLPVRRDHSGQSSPCRSKST